MPPPYRSPVPHAHGIVTGAVARLIFHNFWSFISFGAAASQWALWCWITRTMPSASVHVMAVLALTVANRLAALALEQEQHRRPLARALGMSWLAMGFASFVTAGSLIALAVVWSVAEAIFAWPAEARGFGGAALAEPAFRLFGSTGAAAAALLMIHGYLRGHRRLLVERRTLPLRDLPAALDGLRLVHVSDLHVGPLADRASLARAIARIDELAPDLVCLTGDIVDSEKTEIDAWLPLLARLHARLGVFAILGNHDRDAGFEEVATAIRRGTDWHLLRNETAHVELGGTRLHLLGLEDRRPPHVTARLPELIAQVPAGDFAVLLCHHPDGFDVSAAAGIPLMLAGHTHGGQLAVPGLPQLNVARLLISRRSIGWFRQDGQYLHVSAGLGVSGQRVRVGVPAEITEITLARADDPLPA